MDNAKLIKMAKKGDKQAFCDLYMQYNNRLYRYAILKLGNPEDARDAVSECIVQAYEGIAGLKNENAFNAWIFKIMYRVCCQIITQQSARRNEMDIEYANLGEYSISYESTELAEALASLTKEDKDIVLLSAVAGYNSKEIGAMLGMKPTNVRSRLSRALAKMRSFWSE